MAGDPGAPAPGEGGGGQAVGRQQVPGLGWLGEDAPDYSSEDDNILRARLEILQSRAIGFLHKDCGDGGLWILLQCSMTQLVRFFVLGMLTGCLALHAQNFSGTDTFASDSANWTNGATANGGAFSVSGGVLSFTDAGLTTGQTSSATRAWNLNAGSYAADWQVQIDLTLNLSQVPSQVTAWTFGLGSSLDSSDRVEFTLQQTYMMPGTRYIYGTFITDGTGGLPASMTSTGNTVTLRAIYLAASHQLTLDFNDGSGFTTVTGAIIDGTGLNWGMGLADSFGFGLSASNVTNGDPTVAISSGVYADNFLATGAAIPEPSTYAAVCGALALLVAGLKRRFGQQ